MKVYLLWNLYGGASVSPIVACFGTKSKAEDAKRLLDADWPARENGHIVEEREVL